MKIWVLYFGCCHYILTIINWIYIYSGGRTDFFLFEWHRLPLFVNCDRQVLLCSMFVFLLCNYFVPFVPLISATNCTLFFSVFVNFIFSNFCTLFFRVFVNFVFSNFKTILLCLHVVPLVSFNNSFFVNLY